MDGAISLQSKLKENYFKGINNKNGVPQESKIRPLFGPASKQCTRLS